MRDTEAVQEGLGTDFEIIRELGRGGVSVVYLAQDRMLGREVAVKVIDDRYAGDAESAARFRREARLLAGLQHPNVVPVHAARQLPDGRVALVMQHMAGATLRDLLRREGALPPGRAERVLCDVAEALAYLHRRGIVHRDVKPENVYLDPDGSRAFLSDFGIAKPTDGDSGLTLSGVVLGTPTYMSPEQIDGGWLNGQSDVYALGLVGWEMLTGTRPWAGESLYTVIYKQKHEYLPPLRELRPGIPERLREAVERALLKDRALRWPNAEALVQQLRGSLLPPEPEAAPPPPVLAAVAEEDALTQAIRPAEAAGVWREAARLAERRRQARRRRTAAAVVGVALTLVGLGAAAVVFAKMRVREPLAAPAGAVPMTAPAAAALPAAEPVPAPVPAAVEAAEAAAAPERDDAPGTAAPRPAPVERARPRRNPRPAAVLRAAPRREAAPPAASAAPAGEAPPRLLGEPRLLGTPVNETVRTHPVGTTTEPRITRTLIPRL